MGVTEFARKQTHLTPVVLVGGSFVVGNLSVFLVSTLKEMQAKSHMPGGVDMFDFAILLAGILGSIAINIAAYMNRGYGRWADQRDEQHAQELKLETELRLKAADGAVPPKPMTPEQAATLAEGHLR